jgi:hypothetical protein
LREELDFKTAKEMGINETKHTKHWGEGGDIHTEDEEKSQ